jgi:hypothetical protein
MTFTDDELRGFVKAKQALSWSGEELADKLLSSLRLEDPLERLNEVGVVFSIICQDYRNSKADLAQALLEERQASKTLARAILDAPHGEDCATYLPQLTDPCICWKAAATELARRVVGDEPIKKTKPAILARLKEIGAYMSMVSGHGESDHGLWFSEDYGEVDKLLEYIYGR